MAEGLNEKISKESSLKGLVANTFKGGKEYDVIKAFISKDPAVGDFLKKIVAILAKNNVMNITPNTEVMKPTAIAPTLGGDANILDTTVLR